MPTVTRILPALCALLVSSATFAGAPSALPLPPKGPPGWEAKHGWKLGGVGSNRVRWCGSTRDYTGPA